MKKIARHLIDKYGEESVSHVIKIGKMYAVIRECDNIILVYGKELKGYCGDIIRTMYTGEKYATGDIILVSDRHGVICKF